MKKGIVLLQGAFEIINYGHILSFKRAKASGEFLIVALNSNELLEDYKKRQAVLPWIQKAEIIRSVKYVDKVVKATSFSPLALLKKYDVKVYVIGDEWIETKAIEIEWIKSRGGRIVVLPRYKGVVPTSEIKRRLLKEAQATTEGS